MQTMYFTTVLLLLSFISVVIGHCRIKHPRPLAAPVDSPGGNYYNAPLRPDGSEFPCKGLHKKAGVNKNPTETWQAGQQARFEILGHGTTGGEGSMAAHSGGSCQASLSFDNGETWKVLHTYTGGCPRDVRFGSNMAGKNQTFTFKVPENTKAGIVLFSWTWIAVTGNRNELYQNCASVMITGSGTSTLSNLPDMFVGDLTLAGHIGPGECRSFGRFALEYPNPGEANTIVEVEGIEFKKPTPGKCFTKASDNNYTAPSTSATTPTKSSTTRLSSTSLASTKPTTSVTSKVPTRPVTSTRSTASSTLKVTVKPVTSTKSTASSTSKVTVTRVTSTRSTVSVAGGQLPSQCSTYTLITDKTRRSTSPSHIGCDNAIFKNVSTWVRFSGGAGTRLVTGPTEPFRCGTQGAGWYKDEYPSAAGSTIEGTVCYSWPGKTCQWSNTISITNCKDYYVFALRAPPACYLRYCTI